MLFEVLNALIVGGSTIMAGVQALAGITVHAEETYDYTAALEVAREFRGKHHWLHDDAKRCKFTGVMVPFSRDWEERTTSSDGVESVSAPMPDKLIGHAIILNKKVCVDAPPENVFRIATAPRSLGFQRLVEGYPLTTYNLHELTPGQLPRWAPQVLNRLERLALGTEANPAIKAMVADTKDDFAKIRGMLDGAPQ